MQAENHSIHIVIGVSGSGKSTIAQMLADNIAAVCLDADDYHNQSNIAKMASGTALQDEDRWPWLAAVNAALISTSKTQPVVLACSALKEVYRQKLSKDLSGQIVWVVLNGTSALISDRMQKREHFMPPSLLQSQFDAWEKPSYGIHIDIAMEPELIIERIKQRSNNRMNSKSQIGLIGLGVMGKSLARNIANKGFQISVYNRHVPKVEEDVAKQFVQQYPEMSASPAFDDLSAFVDSLATPRTVFLMVNAGAAVDAVIGALTPMLDADDIIIDGGNSHYKDTERRFQTLAEQGIQYIGSGVSGGEEGALKGPSIMPGGSQEGYAHVSKILTAIAAKDYKENDCCAFIGSGGAGHFVKMVHNGIEYGEMQLLAEVYGILRFQLDKELDEIAAIFKEWLETDCASYLLEITHDIMLKKDGEQALIDIILDKAGNKGTGSWTTIAACELGIAIPTLTAALFARYQSSYIDTRREAAKHYNTTIGKVAADFSIKELRIAYQQARIINHHQGYALIAAASEQYSWNVDYAELSRIWTNGCIIRSALMHNISESLDNQQPNILLNAKLNADLQDGRIEVLRKVVSGISKMAISAPCMTTALSYYNAYTEELSLANIIQGQRDYFGAHTYERRDDPSGKKYHTIWQ